MSLTDTPEEEPSTRLMANDSALEDQVRKVDENRAPIVEVLVVREPSKNTTKTKPNRRHASIDQIVMMIQNLLGTTCK